MAREMVTDLAYEDCIYTGEALDGIPEKVNNMCIQLNSSIETAKNTNEEMLNFSISSIQTLWRISGREKEFTKRLTAGCMKVIS